MAARTPTPPRDTPAAVLLLQAFAPFLFALMLLPIAVAHGGERTTWPLREILDAIRFVESSNRDDVPDGDDGRAIGPYQIHEVYWRDAIAAEPSLGGNYQECRRRDYAERVIAAYMRRHARAAFEQGQAETLARTHNGGPRGPQNPATEAYWRRVRARLP